MKILVWDRQERKNLIDKQQHGLDSCVVPDFQMFTGFSCYKEVDTEHLYFDEEGVIKYDRPD